MVSTDANGNLVSTYTNNYGSTCWAECGDGLRIQSQEECDDGGLQDGDGCSSECYVEWGFVCSPFVVDGIAQQDVCSPICGDYLRRGVEGCDDGNLLAGDGCGVDCQVYRIRLEISYEF